MKFKKGNSDMNNRPPFLDNYCKIQIKKHSATS